MAERSNNYELATPKTRPTTAPEVVDFLLVQALKSQASDIHLGVTQPPGAMASSPWLRFRIHGKLQVQRSDYLNHLYKEVIARFKVLAGVNTAEVGVPQDGQVNLTTAEGAIVLRLNIIPVPDGEEIVIRVQRAQKTPPPDQLGMTQDMLKRVLALVQQKSGMIVLNGPAGSGKTTTIYSLLSVLASPEKKVVTAEDPIELRLPYVNHTAVTRQTSFASLGRAFMRQDADIIFIGEIRDPESAESAMQLAQTGHLVLTSIHTRDSVGVIQRLEAFGVHPNFVANTLIGSLAQRLLPKICPNCRVEAHKSERTVARMGELLPMPQGTPLFKAGPGCDKCNSGVCGRVPIYELLVVDSTISELINRGASRQEILELAARRGMLRLAQEALLRVYHGLVDVDAALAYVMTPDFGENARTASNCRSAAAA